jgi:glycosyltransferase involved in cell wall biosynthesis
MKKKIQRIYFVHQGLLSFVKKDLEILKAKYDVRAINNYRTPLLKVPRNIAGLLWCDLVFCWFGGPRFIAPVVLARLFRKKIVIVAGGYDVVKLPEIGYGNMTGGIRTRLQKLIFRLAHRIICISQSNKREAVTNAEIPNEKITMIYHGFEVSDINSTTKDNMAITIGRVSNFNLRRKGLLPFIDAAQYFPDVSFFLVGSIDKGIEANLPPELPSNLKLTGYVTDEELNNFLMRAKVYVQASMHEGFGCAVAEAMLYECIPVVSDCFALPEVVGDCGYLFEPDNFKDLKAKIQIALNDEESTGKKARSRIVSRFPIEARRKSLLDLIDSL